MSEISKYEAYKKKLQGICDENNLVFRFRRDKYPITLTIRPLTGLDEQMSMLENVEENGYTSPDAAIVFTIKDGVLTYKMSKTFTIGDALFTKVKNLFKNMHYCWLQYFFRDIVEKGALGKSAFPVIDEDEAEDSDDKLPEGAEPLDTYEDEAELPDTEDEPGDEGENPADDGDDTAFDADDPEIVEAAQIVRVENKATTSLLQRRMKIGYAKAARIMDALERLGIIGPYNGADPREVLPFDEPADATAEEGDEPNAD